MPQRIDLTGKQFGSWTMLRVGKYEDRWLYWHVRCVCGVEKELRGYVIRNGASKSCGCQKSALVIASQTTHGMSKSRLYVSWREMRNRCLCPTNKAYPLYGGRGIAISARWDTFEAFRDDMGATWFPSATLERDDVNGNYEPSNCRWITQAQQPTNTRTNVRIETPWGVLHLSEAARRIGCSLTALRYRIAKGRQAPELFLPPGQLPRSAP